MSIHFPYLVKRKGKIEMQSTNNFHKIAERKTIKPVQKQLQTTSDSQQNSTVQKPQFLQIEESKFNGLRMSHIIDLETKNSDQFLCTCFFGFVSKNSDVAVCTLTDAFLKKRNM